MPAAAQLGEVLPIAVYPAVALVCIRFVGADTAVQLVERALADDAHDSDIR